MKNNTCNMYTEVKKTVECPVCGKKLIHLYTGTECNDISIECDVCNSYFVHNGYMKSPKRYKMRQSNIKHWTFPEYENPIDIKCKSCNNTILTAYKGSKAKNLEVFCQCCHKWSIFNFEIK